MKTFWLWVNALMLCAFLFIGLGNLGYLATGGVLTSFNQAIWVFNAMLFCVLWFLEKYVKESDHE